jgi:hypothetical protein
VAELTGTGRLADDLYLMAHNDLTGRPYLQARAIGIGLAGALLAELVITGKIRIWSDGLGVADHSRPRDELARDVLDLVLSEPNSPRDWLMFLGRSATTDVARRLEVAGYLSQVGSRRPWRAGRWVPVDSDCAFAPMFRVRAALDPARATSDAGATLVGLASACGLGPRVLSYGPPGARHCLELAVKQLGPDLRGLIAQTQAAVDGLLLSHRV